MRSDPHPAEKLERLKHALQEMGSVLVAYSGGVDSTFLIKVAKDVLGDRAIAVTASSPTYASHEMEHARKMAGMLGVKHLVVETDETSDPRFFENPPDRCYWCKKRLFSRLTDMARELNLDYVLDGSNYDDRNDFRPGMRAAKEAGVRSVLKEVGLTKGEIREFSKRLGLPTWSRPSSACLASRFPYGTRISEQDLKRIDMAETFLRNLGLLQVRVRHHGTIARIEVTRDGVSRLLERGLSVEVSRYFKHLGYTYVAVDLDGYRTGSMNEVLADWQASPAGMFTYERAADTPFETEV